MDMLRRPLWLIETENWNGLLRWQKENLGLTEKNSERLLFVAQKGGADLWTHTVIRYQVDIEVFFGTLRTYVFAGVMVLTVLVCLYFCK
jgi:ribosomal protein S18 acetylase RimI-like enzyme